MREIGVKLDLENGWLNCGEVHDLLEQGSGNIADTNVTNKTLLDKLL